LNTGPTGATGIAGPTGVSGADIGGYQYFAFLNGYGTFQNNPLQFAPSYSYGNLPAVTANASTGIISFGEIGTYVVIVSMDLKNFTGATQTVEVAINSQGGAFNPLPYGGNGYLKVCTATVANNEVFNFSSTIVLGVTSVASPPQIRFNGNGSTFSSGFLDIYGTSAVTIMKVA
jgi:hypothetical protein